MDTSEYFQEFKEYQSDIEYYNILQYYIIITWFALSNRIMIKLHIFYDVLKRTYGAYIYLLDLF